MSRKKRYASLQSDQRMQQIVFASNQIFSKTPEPVASSHKPFAIIVHLFYPDLYQEIVTYLKQITIPFDLYLTVPPHVTSEELIALFQPFEQVTVYRVENRGRDLLPFLLVLQHIGLDRYPYLCKLHTKKTGGSLLGDVWRKLLFFDLVGTSQTIQKIIDLFEADKSIAQVTGKNTILDAKRYTYGNMATIKRLCEESGVAMVRDYTFAGGTMFWSRPEIFAPVLKLFEEGKLIFEEERGQKDHTLAHALERFFGIIVASRHQRIAPSPADYRDLPVEIVEQTAQLVLSRQYAGEDVYETIAHLNQRIEELERLAESMRLKNRIKRLPSLLWRKGGDGKSIWPARYQMGQFNRYGILLRAIYRGVRSNPHLWRKAWYYMRRGEIGHIVRKIKEKSRNNLAVSQELPRIDPSDYFIHPTKEAFRLPPGHIIDIIIPVYNGYTYLPRLLESLQKHTSYPYRLLVVEDCSSDERVLPFLKKRLQAFENAHLIVHEENLGFVKSVAEAAAKGKDHFVLLNTDTEVPPLWLERLMYPIFSDRRVASTTPFTNAGTIASFPRFLEDNEIFEGMEVAALDENFMHVHASSHYAKIPTGIGFCMGVNRQVVDRIGFFDTEQFGKGYGEENDWCQRAIQHGYENLLVPNLFVYHKHGGSFPSDVKQKLLQKNHQILIQRYPDYDRQVQAYIEKDPHKILRQLLVLRASSYVKPLWVMVDHALGGGANHYSAQLLSSKIADGANCLHIVYDYYAGTYRLVHRYNNYHHAFLLESLEALDRLIEQLRIGTLFVNSLVSFRFSSDVARYLLLLAQKDDAIELIVPIHDYYPLCPSYTLLNDKGQFCQLPSLDECMKCMQNNQGEWRNFHAEEVDIVAWREIWGALFQRANQIICFSRSSSHLIQKVFGDIQHKIQITPHKVEGIALAQPPKRNKSSALTIGVLGAINYAKGSSILKELVQIAEKSEEDVRIVLIGYTTEKIESNRFVVSGRYKREELPSLVSQYGIDLFFIPSICPETFSYTCEEVLVMQMPLVVFDLGAPAERVRPYAKGSVVPVVDAREAWKTILALAKKLHLFGSACDRSH